MKNKVLPADRGLLVVVASVLLGGVPLASAETLRVCHPDGDGPVPDWDPPMCSCPDGDDDPDACCDFLSIQSAIDFSSAGDVICIEAGVYLLEAPITTNGKAVTIRGAIHPDGSPATVLDGQGKGRLIVCESGEGPETVFENLEIRNGSASDRAGGGMYCNGASPTLRNCLFLENRSTGGGDGFRGGGAMHCIGGGPVLESCVFRGNSVGDSQSGGAVFNKRGNPRFEDCVFESNRAPKGRGGAVYNVGDGSVPVVRGSLFIANESQHGGGMYSQSESTNFCSEFIFPSLENCTFRNNKASGSGGGSWSGATIIDYTSCVFEGNTAGVNGGGSYANKDSDVTYVDCEFIENEAGVFGGGASHNWLQEGCKGEGFQFSISLTGCRFAGNSAGRSGGGMHNDIILYLEVEDCEFASNSAESGGGVYCVSTNSDIRSCQFVGNLASDGKGGGAFCSGLSTSVQSCLFDSNVVTVASGSATSGTFGGGGLYLVGESTVSCSSFWGNVVDTTMSEFATGVGGGVCTQDGDGDFKQFFACDLSCNSATHLGGGMYCANEGIIMQCNVTGCSAASGGGIRFNPGAFGGNKYTLAESRVCGNAGGQIAGTYEEAEGVPGTNCIEESCGSCSPLEDPCGESNCLGDLNGDGVVDGQDLSILLAFWNATNPLADINGDGIVDGADLTALLADWGVCPTRWGCSSGEAVCTCQ